MINTTKEMARQNALPKIRVLINTKTIEFGALSLGSYFCLADQFYEYCAKDKYVCPVPIPTIHQKIESDIGTDQINQISIDDGKGYKYNIDTHIVEMILYYEPAYPHIMNFRLKGQLD